MQVAAEAVVLTPPGTVAEVAGIITQVGPAARIMLEKSGTQDDGRVIAQAVAASLVPLLVDGAVRIPAQINVVSARAGMRISVAFGQNPPLHHRPLRFYICSVTFAQRQDGLLTRHFGGR